MIGSTVHLLCSYFLIKSKGVLSMARATNPYNIQKRKKIKTYILTLNPSCGLPSEVCDEWKRRSFQKLPDVLANYRCPVNLPEAKAGVQALIGYLKKIIDYSGSGKTNHSNVTVGKWLIRFTSLEDNPRSAKLIAAGTPYSPDTIEGYRCKFETHLKNDPIMNYKMAEINRDDILAFLGRVGLKNLNLKDSQPKTPIAGTRTYETIVSFLRMAFAEYEEKNHGWFNPFRNIKVPKGRKAVKRDAITEDELLKLFAPGVLTDPLQKAVCAAMFYTGLRRSEIFALKPDALDWKTPRIKVTMAWKRFASKKRVLGDPKCHKFRETIFPLQLQEAIRELWEAYGKHEYVFSRKDGTQPRTQYLKYWIPRWLKRARINTEGRNIVPHSSRHSLASILEADGVPLRYIQKMLGHSRMETTLGYLHEPADTMNKIGKKLSQKAEPEKQADFPEPEGKKVLEFKVS